MAGRYRIIDEPRGTRLRDWAVSPFWPLLGTMLVGVWFGWPWLLFNEYALGGTPRRRALTLMLPALAALWLLAWLCVLSVETGHVDVRTMRGAFPYLNICAVSGILAVSYVAYLRQVRLWSFVDPPARPLDPAIPVLICAWWFGDRFVTLAMRDLGAGPATRLFLGFLT